jgi:hypothetical protein
MLARHVLLVVAPYLYSSYISRNVSQTLYTAGADSASYGFLTGKSNAQFPDFNFYANLSPEFCPGNFEPVGPVSTFLVSELEQNNEACASLVAGRAFVAHGGHARHAHGQHTAWHVAAQLLLRLQAVADAAVWPLLWTIRHVVRPPQNVSLTAPCLQVMGNEFDDAGIHIHLIPGDASLAKDAPPLWQSWSTILPASTTASSFMASSITLSPPVWPTILAALILLYLFTSKSTDPISLCTRSALHRIAKASTHTARVTAIAFVAAHHDAYYLPAGKKYECNEIEDRREYFLLYIVNRFIDVTAGLMDTAPPWISSFAYVMHHCSVHTHDLLDAWVYPKAAVLRPRHCESPRTRRRHTDRRNPSPFYTSADRVAYVSCSRAQYNRRGHDGVGGMRRRAHICARGCIPPAASWLCEEGTVTFERFSSVDHDYHIYESSSAAFVWAKPILLFTVASLILNGIDLMTTKPIIEAIFRATLQSTSAHIFVAVRSLIFLTLPQLVADVVGILYLLHHYVLLLAIPTYLWWKGYRKEATLLLVLENLPCVLCVDESSGGNSRPPIFDGTRQSFTPWLVLFTGWALWKITDASELLSVGYASPTAGDRTDPDPAVVKRVADHDKHNKQLYGAILSAMPIWLTTSLHLLHRADGISAITFLQARFDATDANDLAAALAAIHVSHINPRNDISIRFAHHRAGCSPLWRASDL